MNTAIALIVIGCTMFNIGYIIGAFVTLHIMK